MIYLDNAATTKLDKKALDAMMPYLTESFGNAGTLYSLGREAKEAVEKSRKQVAELIGAKPEQIIFTSGASEANSAVFNSIKEDALFWNKTEILLTNIEHDSVYKAAGNSVTDGIKAKYIPVRSDGTVWAEDVSKCITPKTFIVSVMCVNNETGAMNPIKDIARVCREKGVLFHTDCVQALGQINIDVREIGCDFLTISSHKIHGPKGIGALYVRDPDEFLPMILGGDEQEHGLRGGTENVPAIVGFGKMCEILLKEHNRVFDMKNCKGVFYDALVKELEAFGLPKETVRVNGDWKKTTDKILSITVYEVESQTLILALDSKGVSISAGSACRSSESVPSRTLLTMGLTREEAQCTVRVSFSHTNTHKELIDAAKIMAECISTIKSLNLAIVW